MIPVADIIRQRLIDAGVTWPIYVGYLPDAPDDAFAIYDTTGITDGRIMSTGDRVEHPGIQVRTRSYNYPVARDQIEGAALLLDHSKNAPVTFNTNHFIVSNVTRHGTLNSLGQEEGDKPRYHFTFNAITTIRKDS